MKKFEPRYRLVRYGLATKVEKASRQQRTFPKYSQLSYDRQPARYGQDTCSQMNRQAAQEQDEGVPRHRQDQGRCEEGQEISGSPITMTTRVTVANEWWFLLFAWCFTITAGSELHGPSPCTAMKSSCGSDRQDGWRLGFIYC